MASVLEEEALTLHRSLSQGNECAICFEVLQHTTVLPCKCNVLYCSRCWDRCLLQSFDDSGQARCPTCRSAIHVQFLPDQGSRGRLVFSEEKNTPQDSVDKAVMRREHLMRIRLEVRPATHRLLKSYGEENGHLDALAQAPATWLANLPEDSLKAHITALGGKAPSAEDIVDKGVLVELLQLTAGTTQKLVSHVAAANVALDRLPMCVCGSVLRPMSGRERVCQVLKAHFQSEAAFQAALQDVPKTGSSTTVCDLCNCILLLEDTMWNCEKGTQTILHHEGYDLCIDCFFRAVSGEPSLQTWRQQCSI